MRQNLYFLVLSLHHTHEILPLGYELATVFLSASPRPLTLATVTLVKIVVCEVDCQTVVNSWGRGNLRN